MRKRERGGRRKGRGGTEKKESNRVERGLGEGEWEGES